MSEKKNREKVTIASKAKVERERLLEKSDIERARIIEKDKVEQFRLLEKTKIEHRLNKAETRIDVVEESISEVRDISIQVKEHILKQNGVLPRLEKSFTSIAEQINSFDKKLDFTSEKLVAVSVKVKVLWAACATIGAAVLVAILGFLMSKV